MDGNQHSTYYITICLYYTYDLSSYGNDYNVWFEEVPTMCNVNEYTVNSGFKFEVCMHHINQILVYIM